MSRVSDQIRAWIKAVGRAVRPRRPPRWTWEQRIAEVLTCPDNAALPRVPEAGRIVDGCQIMHNGLKVVVDGYYGDGVTRMLESNRGCHEPQEEVVFAEVLRQLPETAVIIECGAYWGFYSMWFCQSVKQPRAFLIEPEAPNLAIGRRNFELNGFTGDFTCASIGGSPNSKRRVWNTLQIDDFLARHRLELVHILHCDIQGFELEMLRGAARSLDARRIRYIFISTHSEKLHARCAAFLGRHGYRVAVSVTPAQSFSMDGILVALDSAAETGPLPQPSRKPAKAR